ncbi:MAG TPA: MarR family transcriptional regulator [candidate division Zixibacteria bacterium]|nr:MarR family transcriptional regulator [candidate division Zixibacteria bacterium]
MIRTNPRPAARAVEELLAALRPWLADERARFAAHCHERGISMAHLHLMGLLERNGPMAMSAVAGILGTELPTVTGLVDRMEDRGLVERVRDEGDRRVVLVTLTEAGAALLSELHALRRERLAAALAFLDEGQRARLLAAFGDLRRAFERLAAEEDAR